MCLILLAWRVHADYPLVVAANRDEFFARPTAAADFWVDQPTVLAGRDLEAGGTWMGMTRSGRFAALTNYRSPEHHQAGRPSRGQLVADFLTGASGPEAYLQDRAEFGQRCNGYNLLVSDGNDLYCASNVSGEIHRLKPGVYGLSNHLLDTPWPKVGAGRTALEQALGALPDQHALFNLLTNDLIHPDHALPATGVPMEWERLLSAAFIKSPDYGTRTSTVLCRRADGMASYDEQTWLPGAARGERRRFRLQCG
jgi:uncharacterized protein with NRDE domain